MPDVRRISEEERQQALSTCLKDPHLRRLYVNAPDGARKVIALSFYSTVFPDRIDGHRFRGLLRELSPELTETDLFYLIRFEEDAALKRHFRALLDEKTAPRRKLGVMRPGEGHETGTVDLNAEAMKRRMSEEEADRIRQAEKASAAERKARREAFARNLIISLVTVLVLGGAGYALVSWQTRRAATEAAIRQRQEEIAREETAKYDAEREAALRRAEEERRAKAAADKARKEKNEKLFQERRAAEQARRAAEERRYEERRAAVARFDAFEKSFEGLTLKPWSVLPKKERPGAGAGLFACYTADGGGRFGFYEITSEIGGFAVTNLLSDGTMAAMEARAFTALIEEHGCLTRVGDSVYFLPPKERQKGIPLTSARFNPTESLLGIDLGAFVTEKHLKTRHVLLALHVANEGQKLGAPDATVSYNEYFDSCKLLRELKRKIAAEVPKRKPKQKKRRVVFYDGDKLEVRMEIVRVPRNPIRQDEKYRKWFAEAEREEQAERDACQRVEEDYEKAVAAAIERELSRAKLLIRMVMK